MTASGAWPGTRRQVRKARAVRGMTVKRAAAGDGVHVERRPRPQALERRVAGLAVKRGHTDFRAVGVLVERDARDRLAVGCGERPHAVVEAGHGDGSVRVVQAGEDPRERVVRVLHRATVAAGVQVGGRSVDDDVDREHSFRRDRDRRLRRAATSRRRPRRRGRRIKLVAMLAQERREARAADLLLALDQEADVQWQRAGRRDERFRDLQGHEHRALVVGRAARVDSPVTDARLEWRRRPLALVAGRLHVVVAVDEDRRCAGRAEPLAEDDRLASVSTTRPSANGSCAATHSAASRIAARFDGSPLMLGMARNSVSSRR